MFTSKKRGSPTSRTEELDHGPLSDEEMAACLRIFREELPNAEECAGEVEGKDSTSSKDEMVKPDLARWHRVAKKVRL